MIDESSIFATNYKFNTSTSCGGRRQRPMKMGGKFGCIYYTLIIYKHIAQCLPTMQLALGRH